MQERFPRERVPEESGFERYLKEPIRIPKIPTVDEADQAIKEGARKAVGKGLINLFDSLRQSSQVRRTLSPFKGDEAGKRIVKGAWKKLPEPVKAKAHKYAPPSKVMVPLLEMLDPAILTPKITVPKMNPVTGKRDGSIPGSDSIRAYDLYREALDARPPREERQIGMTGWEKAGDRMPELFRIPDTGEILGRSYQKYVKQEEIDDKIYTELDRDYLLEPIIPPEATQWVRENYGDEAAFGFDAFREITTPLDMHIVTAAMLARNPKGKEAADIIKKSAGGVIKKEAQKKTAQKGLTGAKWSAPKQGVIAPKVPATPAYKRIASGVGNVLKPYGYHTPGLKGFLIRGGSELALGTAFVASMRGIDAGISKYAPEFKEENPITSMLISFAGGFAAPMAGVAGGQITFGVGRQGWRAASEAIPGTKANMAKKEINEINEALNQIFQNDRLWELFANPVMGGSSNDIPNIDPIDLMIKNLLNEFDEIPESSFFVTGTEDFDKEFVRRIISQFSADDPKVVESGKSYTEYLLDQENADLIETMKNSFNNIKIPREVENLFESYKKQFEFIQNSYFEARTRGEEIIAELRPYLDDQRNLKNIVFDKDSARDQNITLAQLRDRIWKRSVLGESGYQDFKGGFKLEEVRPFVERWQKSLTGPYLNDGDKETLVRQLEAMVRFADEEPKASWQNIKKYLDRYNASLFSEFGRAAKWATAANEGYKALSLEMLEDPNFLKGELNEEGVNDTSMEGMYDTLFDEQKKKKKVKIVIDDVKEELPSRAATAESAIKRLKDMGSGARTKGIAWEGASQETNVKIINTEFSFQYQGLDAKFYESEFATNLSKAEFEEIYIPKDANNQRNIDLKAYHDAVVETFERQIKLTKGQNKIDLHEYLDRVYGNRDNWRLAVFDENAWIYFEENTDYPLDIGEYGKMGFNVFPGRQKKFEDVSAFEFKNEGSRVKVFIKRSQQEIKELFPNYYNYLKYHENDIKRKGDRERAKTAGVNAFSEMHPTKRTVSFDGFKTEEKFKRQGYGEAVIRDAIRFANDLEPDEMTAHIMVEGNSNEGNYGDPNDFVNKSAEDWNSNSSKLAFKLGFSQEGYKKNDGSIKPLILTFGNGKLAPYMRLDDISHIVKAGATTQETPLVTVKTKDDVALELDRINNELQKNRINYTELTQNNTADEWADFVGIPKITAKSGKSKVAAQKIRTEVGQKLKKILHNKENLDGRELTSFQLKELEKVMDSLVEYRKLAGNLKVLQQFKKAILFIVNNSKNGTGTKVSPAFEIKPRRKRTPQEQARKDRGFDDKVESDPSDVGAAGNVPPKDNVTTNNMPDPEDGGEYGNPTMHDAIDFKPHTIREIIDSATGKVKTNHERIVSNTARNPIPKDELDYTTEMNITSYWKTLTEPQRLKLSSIVQNTIARSMLMQANPNLFVADDKEFFILRSMYEMWKEKELSLADAFIEKTMYTLQREFDFNVKGGGINKSNWRKKMRKVRGGGLVKLEGEGQASKLRYADDMIVKDEKGKVIADYSLDKRQLENADMTDAERMKKREEWLIKHKARGHKYLRTMEDIINSLDKNHPSFGRYDLTQNQKAALKWVDDHTTYQYRQMGEMFDRLKIDDPDRKAKILANEKEYYWHRQVIDYPSEAATRKEWLTEKLHKFLNTSTSRHFMGTKTDFVNERLFEDIDELIDLGYTIQMNPKESLRARLHQGIELIGKTLVTEELEKKAKLIRRSTKFEASIEGSQAIRAEKAAKEAYKATVAEFNKVKARVKKLKNPSTADDQQLNILAENVRYYGSRLDRSAKDLFDLKSPAMRKNYGEEEILGKPIPKEFEKEVIKNFGDLLDGYRQGKAGFANEAILELVQGLRAFLTTGELAVMGIQLNKLMVSDPLTFGRVIKHGILKHIENPHAYYEHNYEMIQSGIKFGAISQPTEFLYQSGLSSFPIKIPVAGAYFDITNQFFEKCIFIAQCELWKAATDIKQISSTQRYLRSVGSFLPGVKDSTYFQRMGIVDTELHKHLIEGDLDKVLRGTDIDPQEFQAEVAGIAAAIRRDVGTENLAQIGRRGALATAEQYALFANRFFRAVFSQFITSFKPGEAGRYARRSMVSFLTGMGAIGMGLQYTLTGKPMNILHPERSDYFTITAPDGTLIPLLGPQGRVIKAFMLSMELASKGETKRARQVWENFLASKAGVLPRTMLDTMTLFVNHEIKTFDGEIINLSTNGMWVGLKGRMPIILQQLGPALFPENDPLKRNLDIPLSKVRPFAIVEFIGFNAKDPKTLNVQRNYVSNKLYGKNYNDIQEEGDLVALSKINNDPAVELIRLESAIKWGGYREQETLITAEFYKRRMGLLEDLFYNENGQVKNVTSNDIYVFRNKVRDLDNQERGQRDQNRRINGSNFDEEEWDEPQNWREAALYDYFDIIDKSVDKNGNFQSKIFVEAIKEQEEKWTDEQNAYIVEYRERKTFPPGFAYLKDFDSKLSGPEFQEAIKDGRAAALGYGDDVNYSLIYIYQKHLAEDPESFDTKEFRQEALATPTPMPRSPMKGTEAVSPFFR